MTSCLIWDAELNGWGMPTVTSESIMKSLSTAYFLDVNKINFYKRIFIPKWRTADLYNLIWRIFSLNSYHKCTQKEELISPIVYKIPLPSWVSKSHTASWQMTAWVGLLSKAPMFMSFMQTTIANTLLLPVMEAIIFMAPIFYRRKLL